MKALMCLRCGAKLDYAGREKLQLGQTGWLLGDLPNLVAGALEVELYACPDCGKLELFAAGSTAHEEETPQRTCPRCGKRHDFDYPKCPYCGHDYYGA